MAGHQGPVLRSWDWGFGVPVAASGTTVQVAAVVGWWVATGALVVALLAVRHLERPPGGPLTVVLGPLLLLWVVARFRGGGGPEEIAPGAHAGGDVHVLITTPEDPTQVAALDPLVQAIGPDLGTVTVTRARRKVGLLGRWGADPAQGGDATGRDGAVRELSQAALFLTVEPRLVVLPDSSVRTLRRLVRTQSARLVVVLDDRRTVAGLRRTAGPPAVRVIAPSRPEAPGGGRHRDQEGPPRL